ncbi:MAG: DUF1572 domain-containing protein [Eudoraea sp.]|nr:DUF1572 domain-containing protein [Eudoraea sp.]
MTLQETYLRSVEKEFRLYKSLGEKTFVQLTDQDIHWKYQEYDNPVSVIVKHLVGNMLSRFTNFLTEDGEKPWRHRESEFEDSYATKKEMLAAWEKGWKCLFEAIASINAHNFNDTVRIRNEEHSIIAALNRQLGHYANHIGQILMLGKMIRGAEWVSPTIARGGSAAFNKAMFGK